MLVLESLVGFHRTIQHHLFITGWGIELDYCDLNGFPWKQTDYSVVFEIAPKNCILDSFVDHEGYSISSKGFLPTAVDIMDI